MQQPEEPPQFFGGIIADPMGLGKTLTMIALAATGLDSGDYDGFDLNIEDEDKSPVSATLVVMPAPRKCQNYTDMLILDSG